MHKTSSNLNTCHLLIELFCHCNIAERNNRISHCYLKKNDIPSEGSVKSDSIQIESTNLKQFDKILNVVKCFEQKTHMMCPQRAVGESMGSYSPFSFTMYLVS